MKHNVKLLILVVLVLQISHSYQYPELSDNINHRRSRRASQCECVDKKLCDRKTNTIISNGEGILNVRSLEACAANEVCCFPPESATSESTTTVDPNGGERIFEGFYDEDIKDDPPPESIDEVEYVEATENAVKLVTEASSSSFFLCGARTDAYSQMLKVSGDPDKTETAEGEFPWMLVLKYRSPNSAPSSDQQFLKLTSPSLYLCGASLILPAVAITAAHCVDQRETENLLIRAGEWDLGSDDESYFPEERNVKKVVMHPNYDKYPIKYDLALLIFDKALKSSVAINTICLPHKGLELPWSGCYATGWGAKSKDAAPSGDQTLKKAKLPLVARDKCQDLLRQSPKLGRRFKLHKSFMCAGGDDDTDTCKGDGGGPLACQMKDPPHSFFLVGVTSWGVGCGRREFPGVYVDITEMSDWINSSVKQLIEDNEIPSD